MPATTAQKLFAKYKNAVVRISSSFSLTRTAYTADTVPQDLASYFLSGNGFFIKGLYITCPANLVLIAPTALAIGNRFPYESATITAPTGVVPNRMVRVNRVLVDIIIHQTAYTYEADIVGVDGAGNVAILRISHKRQWNLTNPKIPKSQPFFMFTNSDCAYVGSDVFAIGSIVAAMNPTSNNVNGLAKGGVYSVVAGTVANNRNVDLNGYVFSETVLTDLMVGGENVGLPFIQEKGDVIGMQTIHVSTLVNILAINSNAALGDGGCAGPSSNFMWPVIETLIEGHKSRCFLQAVNSHLLLISDPMGDYLRYTKGYAGVFSTVLTGKSYDVTYPGSSVILERFSPTGQLLNSPGLKQVVGVVVKGLAGVPGPVLVPGAIPEGVFPALVDTVLPPDATLASILMSLDKHDLGCLELQVSPAVVTWRKVGGDKVKLLFRTYLTSYETVYEAVITLADFPPLLDYPYYKIGDFPAPSVGPIAFAW